MKRTQNTLLSIFSFFKKNIPKRKIKKTPKHSTEGLYYDLKKIYKEVNEKYFQGTLNLKIGWFGNKDFLPKSKITLGSYHTTLQFIKIHRILDQPHIPLYFISFIVYHEILHHVDPPLIKSSFCKRKIHHSSFKEREKKFEEYPQVKIFNKELKKLLFQNRLDKIK